MDIDADKDRIRVPLKLAVAVAAGFIFWYVSTYILPITDEIIQLREQQARDRAEHESMQDRMDAQDRRIDRMEDRLNAGKSN